MDNDKFQKLVLENFLKINDEISGLKTDITSLKTDMNKRFDKIDIKLNGIEDQTRKNSEFIFGIVELAKKAK